MKEVVIVSAVRTPIGGFMGSLSSLSATQLGSIAIKGALDKINLNASEVQEVLMGNVLQANVGQAPARQAALGAGISNEVPCTTINKVCSSGMKAIMMAAQSIKAGDADVIVAGGMESMSNVPHYLEGRNGVKLGDIKAKDGLLRDGLIDVYNQTHMGNCAELCAKDMNFSREQQDEFALESYRRSAASWENGKFAEEVIPVSVPQRKGDPIIVDRDEDVFKVNHAKVPTLRPVFDKEGTVTAANASNLNDGAAALVIMSAEKAASLGLTPIAKINAYADAAHEPEWFTTAPAKALPKALAKAGIDKDQVDAFELNEAFSVVGLANIQLLDIDAAKTNVNGGAVSMGHPLGASGARIIVSLISVLKQNQGKYGAAGICNGGGGASAMVIENMA
ncbi:acetyl-CoA C-acyltransferase [Croceimicrobium hydrocarbonivorans]|uniref:acetyl-CoA C-acetyltransferase n=1 Tax=Croceimicrobium hydrocarbonivorans TaxID=2761580 RepID=A0A7H0VFL6_9FLAO|nr:acetyl-CoA C-acyltransferase [Croceimicrobium hydrocarbonivorans]QNR24514.1 acetyl-CoA C-acyltransferase [Croceimicrobium hydrocarbonivorans]